MRRAKSGGSLRKGAVESMLLTFHYLFYINWTEFGGARGSPSWGNGARRAHCEGFATSCEVVRLARISSPASS